MYKGGIVSGDIKPVLRRDLVIPHEQAEKLLEIAKNLPRDNEWVPIIITKRVPH